MILIIQLNLIHEYILRKTLFVKLLPYAFHVQKIAIYYNINAMPIYFMMK